MSAARPLTPPLWLVPCVSLPWVGLKTASENVATGDYVLLDGFNGVLVINPTDQTLFEYGQLEKEQENLQDKLAEIRDAPAITLDGHEIMLSANVEQITDTVAVLECGAQGVGLFRTEYLFLDRKTLPNEEEQYTSYQRVAKAIAPETVIFRTAGYRARTRSAMPLAKPMKPTPSSAGAPFAFASRARIFSTPTPSFSAG